MTEGIVKRSVAIAGHRTSVSLEEPFWDELKRMANERGTSLNGLIAEIDASRARTNLSSAIRLEILADLKKQGVN
ncbi:MAG: ribbon-helix-helix domain-containing protein [Beijerinckiaceae bacterium]|nr:ribbon-helix-helix domain-containing protein [Beijerinckiaceae bacterium]